MLDLDLFSTHYYQDPIPVQGCPSNHTNPVNIISFKATEPETIQLYPGIHTTNPGEVIGYDLSCGCFITAKKFELMIMPGEVPYIRRRKEGGDGAAAGEPGGT